MVVPSLGIMFHHFADDKYGFGAQGEISADKFMTIINAIGRNNIIGAHEWMDRAENGTLGDDKFCITFDDALKSQMSIAYPILEELNLTAFYFVYSSVFQGTYEKFEIYRYHRCQHYKSINEFYIAFIDAVAEMGFSDELNRLPSDELLRNHLSSMKFYSFEDRKFRFLRDNILGPDKYCTVMDSLVNQANYNFEALQEILWMNDEDLKLLNSSGNLIGLHSYSHPTKIDSLCRKQQMVEYGKNSEHLTDILGQQPTSMSHPSNSYNFETIEILRDMDVKVGFRADRTVVDSPSEFELPRIDCADFLREMIN